MVSFSVCIGGRVDTSDGECRIETAEFSSNLLLVCYLVVSIRRTNAAYSTNELWRSLFIHYKMNQPILFRNYIQLLIVQFLLIDSKQRTRKS